MAGGWLGSCVSDVPPAAAPARVSSPLSRAFSPRIFSARASSCGWVISLLSTSSNATLPSSLYVWLSSRLTWTSSTPSFAFAVACSAACFALSRNPIGLLLFAEDAAEDTAAAGFIASTPGSCKNAACGAREGQRLQGHVAGASHMNEEQPLAPKQALRDAALHLHLVGDTRLEHHHTTRVDDQPLTGCQIEVEEISAAVQPDRA